MKIKLSLGMNASRLKKEHVNIKRRKLSLRVIIILVDAASTDIAKRDGLVSRPACFLIYNSYVLHPITDAGGAP